MRTVPHNSSPFHPTMDMASRWISMCEKKTPKNWIRIANGSGLLHSWNLFKYLEPENLQQPTTWRWFLWFFVWKKGEPFLQRVRFSALRGWDSQPSGVGLSSVLASRHGTVMEPPELEPEWTLGMWGSRRTVINRLDDWQQQYDIIWKKLLPPFPPVGHPMHSWWIGIKGERWKNGGLVRESSTVAQRTQAQHGLSDAQ